MAHFAGVKSVGVCKMNGVADTSAKEKLTAPTKTVGEFLWKYNEIVTANGHKFHYTKQEG
jgi:hypothetical protein